jgi:hypothetical protein
VNKHALMSVMGVLGNGNYFYIRLSFPDQISVKSICGLVSHFSSVERF